MCSNTCTTCYILNNYVQRIQKKQQVGGQRWVLSVHVENAIPNDYDNVFN